MIRARYRCEKCFRIIIEQISSELPITIPKICPLCRPGKDGKEKVLKPREEEVVG